MKGGFRRTQRGVAATFDEMQAGVLRHLAADIEELMGAREVAEPDVAPTPAPGADPFEALFADFSAGATTRPDDPVLARLLPDGYSAPTGDGNAKPTVDTEAAAADFRRFTEPDLRAGKTANAQTILTSVPVGGGSVLLDDDEAESWLRGLNDMRLALGTALEVGPDTDREFGRIDPMSSRGRRLHLYMWLGVLQETLLESITDG
ncbi:MAG: hypothetical protein QOJ32_2062 [Frankiaceae bacterium]|nr:hypothetical protein [Frankiaceae bacterium]MDQ1650306.1 hypothetical protein [Frankiaceae bacterium]